MRPLFRLLFVLSACAEDPPTRTDGGEPDAGDADVAEHDAASLDSEPLDAEPLDVPVLLPCDEGFSVSESAPQGTPLVVRFTHPTIGLTNIGLHVAGDGTPSARFEEVESDSAPYRWRFTVEGHAPTRLHLEVFADPDARVYATCSVRVTGAGDAGVHDAGVPDAGLRDAGTGDVIARDTACIPACRDAACGADDGCGAACSGAHRDEHGGVSDCRLAGNCGCGVEPNDNMECTSGGMCRIRCSCDCLPPQLRSADAVAGLDHGGSCTLVFRESGDPTVWDAANERALCPVDHDPTSEAHCAECPPCHRSRDQCGLGSWCECTDAGYRARDPQYNALCGG